jgi:hypothetical protein
VATAPGQSSNIPYPVATGGVTTTPATTITGISGSTITLSQPVASGTGSAAPTILYFPGHPPILSVSNLNG